MPAIHHSLACRGILPLSSRHHPLDHQAKRLATPRRYKSRISPPYFLFPLTRSFMVPHAVARSQTHAFPDQQAIDITAFLCSPKSALFYPSSRTFGHAVQYYSCITSFGLKKGRSAPLKIIGLPKKPFLHEVPFFIWYSIEYPISLAAEEYETYSHKMFFLRQT